MRRITKKNLRTLMVCLCKAVAIGDGRRETIPMKLLKKGMLVWLKKKS